MLVDHQASIFLHQPKLEMFLLFSCLLSSISHMFRLSMVLMSNGISAFYKAFGQTFIHDDKFIGQTVGGLFPIFNCIGRVFWGILMDKTAYKVTKMKPKHVQGVDGHRGFASDRPHVLLLLHIIDRSGHPTMPGKSSSQLSPHHQNATELMLPLMNNQTGLPINAECLVRSRQ